MRKVLAIDLGGTNFRAALFPDSAITPDAVPDAIVHQTAPASLAAFVEIVDGLVGAHEIDAIGIGIPGLVSGTVCQWVPNLPWLDGADLAALFPGVEVSAANDAHLSLLAEAAGGAARDTGNAILLAMGTGIGSALLVDGRIARGAGGSAVSFGWACARYDDEGDDQHGWLERHASGRAFDREARALNLSHGAELVAAARAGRMDARAALDRIGGILGAALAGAVALTGAQKVVISGGVSSALDLFGAQVLARLHAHVPPHMRSVSLVSGAFGSRAAICGAALAAHRHPIWREK